MASIDPDRDGVEDSVLAARGAGIRVAARRLGVALKPLQNAGFRWISIDFHGFFD